MSYQYDVDPFPALADPVRRALLRRLARGPARVVDLAAEHPVSRPAVSRHLRVLGEAGLVRAEVRGRERHYSVAPEGLRPVAALLGELQGELLGELQAPVTAEALDALDLEVRRTVRERAGERADGAAPTEQEETA